MKFNNDDGRQILKKCMRMPPTAQNRQRCFRNGVVRGVVLCAVAHDGRVVLCFRVVFQSILRWVSEVFVAP